MKTFSEACHAILIRKQKTPDEPVPQDMLEQVERWQQIRREIEESEEADLAVMGLMQLAAHLDLPVEKALKIAFSHGVTVGMVMERREEGIEEVG